MEIIILAGIPGSGKTTLRLAEYADVPFIDMADLHASKENVSGSWREAMHMLFNEVFNHKGLGTPALLLEGIFNPGSTSLKWVKSYCVDYNIAVEVIQLEAPLAICLQRIIADWRIDGDDQRLAARTYFAGKYSGNFT